MGIYWNSCLYQGRLLRQSTLEKLMRQTEVPDSFLIPNEYTVLHAPGQYLNIDVMDPVLESHGYVDQDEVINQLIRNRDMFDSLQHLKTCNVWATLSRSPQKMTVPYSALYIAEVEWCTLEENMPPTLRANLPCLLAKNVETARVQTKAKFECWSVWPNTYTRVGPL